MFRRGFGIDIWYNTADQEKIITLVQLVFSKARDTLDQTSSTAKLYYQCFLGEYSFSLLQQVRLELKACQVYVTDSVSTQKQTVLKLSVGDDCFRLGC